MALLCSVDAALQISGTTQSGNTLSASDRVKVQASLRGTTKRVNELFRPLRPPFMPAFEPYNATRKYPIDSANIRSLDNTFLLDDFLLETTGTLSVNGTNVTSVETYPDSSYPPFKLLRLTDWSLSWYDYCDSTGAPLQLSVPGIWGFNRDYDNAWLEVDALAANMTTTTATALTVADVDADDAYGLPVRISPGHLIKVGSEYMEVVATNTSTNVVTVRRGANGSTAATHSSEDKVYRWQVEDDVQRVVARQAMFQFSRYGAYTTVEVQGMGEIRFPNDLLRELQAVMQSYQYG